MRPAIVLPMHDPSGTVFPLLHAVTPTLKTIFNDAFISVTKITSQRYPQHLAAVCADPFFHVFEHAQDVSVGEDFWTLFDYAATHGNSAQVLHLCFIDRVAFALQSAHRAQFIADMQTTDTTETPLIFARSEIAWQTHPRNYRQLETMVTEVGDLLYGRRLDFCWCHVAFQTEQLREIVPQLQRRDLGVCAELILAVVDRVQMCAVDWLAWEDPFVLGCPADTLRQERETSLAEVEKRLGYVVPMLQQLQQHISRGGSST